MKGKLLSKAIFLDRDGVINKKRDDYVKNIDEFVLLNDVIEAIKLLKKRGFLIIIITNQSAINRGYLTHDGLEKIHQHMRDQFQKYNILIDAIYYCPHHPDENCMCRKPQPGLLGKAIKDFSIIKHHSLLIGDSDSDIEAAKQAGIKSVKISTDSSLLELVKQILKKKLI